MRSERPEITVGQVRRLAKRLRSRRASVRQAAEQELARIGPQAAECWAAHARLSSDRDRWILRGLGIGLVVAPVLAALLLLLWPMDAALKLDLAGVVVMVPLAVGLLSIPLCPLWLPALTARWVLRTLRRQERNVLRLLVRVDDPRVLDALLPAIQRNISGISNVLGWQACDHALALFERLPDEPAARCLVRQPEPLHIALRCCDSSPECVHRALRLIALLRRTDSVGSLTCLRELQTLPLAAQGIAPRVIEAAAECAAYLRRIADERRRNALLLRPASAPTDALLRPASAPQGDTDLLLRPRGQEDAP